MNIRELENINFKDKYSYKGTLGYRIIITSTCKLIYREYYDNKQIRIENLMVMLKKNLSLIIFHYQFLLSNKNNMKYKLIYVKHKT